MPHDRHTELRRLFDRAIELPVAVRSAFLDSNRGLQERLLAMLAAADDEHFQMPTPSGSSLADSPARKRRHQDQLRL